MYVNPYITVTPRDYTCHIFNGSQRIASIVGSSNLTACIDTTASDTALTKVRSYMQTLFAQEIELHPDTTATFVTNA